jgi:4'-phosphopantetheinyl transferase
MATGFTAVRSLEPGKCEVWWADRDAAADHLLPVLDDGERARLSRFRRAEDRALYLVGHATLRLRLAAQLRVAPSELRFSTICRYCGKTHGKPRLEDGAAGLEFSLSHSGRQAVVAVALHLPLGVDVEQLRSDRNRASLIPAILSDDEQLAIARVPAGEQAAAFLRYWTRKEALLKATGHGLAVGLRRLTVSAPDEAPALIAWSADSAPEEPAQLFDLAARPGHLAALAVLGDRPRVSEHDAGPLLASTSEAQPSGAGWG